MAKLLCLSEIGRWPQRTGASVPAATGGQCCALLGGPPSGATASSRAAVGRSEDWRRPAGRRPAGLGRNARASIRRDAPRMLWAGVARAALLRGSPGPGAERKGPALERTCKSLPPSSSRKLVAFFVGL